MIKINGDACHNMLRDTVVPKFAFDKKADFAEYKRALKKKFTELFGFSEIEKNACPQNVTIEYEKKTDKYRQIRFVIETEKENYVPCYLLIPNGNRKKYPVAITLQGHSTGFHNSIGEPNCEWDEKYMPRGAFALQAVENGFAALAIEMRGMGELKTFVTEYAGETPLNCQQHARMALLLGRTLLGERIWDVSRAIDALLLFPEADADKILITGNSGGGTVSYYAACYDERIKFTAPSCSFCPYPDSIMSILHCICNFIPKAYLNFDMQDLAALIAPRRLSVIAGEKDPLFPIGGVKKGYETLREIYRATDAEKNLSLIVTPEAHYWCENIVWKEIKRQADELGW